MAIITTRWDSAEHLKTDEDIQLRMIQMDSPQVLKFSICSKHL
ncbi:MAG: hypothetical protein ACRC1Z_17570 [Waterburya sp.]